MNFASCRFSEVRFCLWSGSQSAPMDHPAATLPCIPIFPPPRDTDPVQRLYIYALSVWGSYVIWKLDVMIDLIHNYSIHVHNWGTGKMISVCIRSFSSKPCSH